MRTPTLMYKIFSCSLILLAFSCSTDEEPMIIEEPVITNAVPLMANQQFEVSENTGDFKTIANIVATDTDGDLLTFSLESDIDLLVRSTTGAVTTTSTSILDYETAQSLSFDISVRDTKGGSTTATITINVLDEDDGPLTNYQKSFIDEYIYVTYKLSPTASGGPLSEKWQGQINLFLEGNLPANYEQTVQGYLEEFNAFFTDGTNLALVTTQEESNVHLIMGPTTSVQQEWPDMYSLINGSGFGGYALNTSNVDYNLNNGRIWMQNDNEGLFKHELGHIIGLGHTSDAYCDGTSNSVMCPGTAVEFTVFDTHIIKTLYRTETPVGLSQAQMRVLVDEYLVQGDIVL